jgi:hypothetical protein
METSFALSRPVLTSESAARLGPTDLLWVSLSETDLREKCGQYCSHREEFAIDCVRWLSSMIAEDLRWI